MPHYRDGSLAKVGDLVRGKGYNLRDAAGELREFTGTLVSVNPNTDSCNVQVAHLMATAMPKDWQPPPSNHFVTACGVILVWDGSQGLWVMLQVDIEYGQADHFERIS